MRLKNTLEREFNTAVKVKTGAPGSFDVFFNGTKVYSKKQSGHLPSADELAGLLRPLLPAAH